MDGAGVILLILIVGAFGLLVMRDMRRAKKRKALICNACGAVGQVKTHTRGNLLIEIILWIFFIIPGLIYSIWRHSSKSYVCSACGSDQLIPIQSPKGQELLSRYHAGEQATS